jgi:hypothetical protein
VESPLHTQRVNSENFGLTLELPDGRHDEPLSGCGATVVPFMVKPSVLKLFISRAPRFVSE